MSENSNIICMQDSMDLFKQTISTIGSSCPILLILNRLDLLVQKLAQHKDEFKALFPTYAGKFEHRN